MLVAKNLLNRRIPTAFLEVSHQEVKQSRRVLEILVIRARTAAGRKTDKSTTCPAERNRLNITPEEERRYSGENLYLDNGVFSASRELAILNQQVAQHHEEDQSIEDVIKARSEFKSRELTRGHAEAKKSRNIAQSPDEIRQKLDGQTSAEGTSSFTAKNPSRRALKPPLGVRDKTDIAQSPAPSEKSSKGKPAPTVNLRLPQKFFHAAPRRLLATRGISHKTPAPSEKTRRENQRRR